MRVVNKPHVHQSDIEAQANAFRNCFKPVAFRLEKRFNWMTESQREELGQKADEALKNAYIDHLSEMYETKDGE